MMAKTSLLGTVVNLLFPIDCLVCGNESNWLCDDCLKNFQKLRLSNCFICTKTTETGVCKTCQQNTGIDGAIPVLPYGQLPGVRLLIETAKRQDGHGALGFITDTFRQRILRLLPEEIDVVTFSPLSKSEEKERGYNPAQVMAERLAGGELPVVDLFEKVKDSPKQTRQTKNNIPRSVRGMYRLKTKRLPEALVIVDDVVTTGDTLETLAKLAKKHGANTVWVVTICHG